MKPECDPSKPDNFHKGFDISSWSEVDTTNIHDWIYETKERRSCIKCGRCELFWGFRIHHGDEDWRRASGKIA